MKNIKFLLLILVFTTSALLLQSKAALALQTAAGNWDYVDITDLLQGLYEGRDLEDFQRLNESQKNLIKEIRGYPKKVVGVGYNCESSSDATSCSRWFIPLGGSSVTQYVRFDEYLENTTPVESDGIIRLMPNGDNQFIGETDPFPNKPITEYTVNVDGNASNPSLSYKYSTEERATNDPGTISQQNNDSKDEEQDEDTLESCEEIGASVAWIICGVLDLADKVISYADNQIHSLLTLPSSYYDNPELKASWANIRNIAYIVLIPIMLVMVIGTALGFSFIDAYTVKKVLPRVIAAVLFMAISYEVAVFAIEFTETLGRGVAGLIGSNFELTDGTKAYDVTLQKLFDPNNTQGGLVLTGAILGIGAGLAVISLGVIASYALVMFVALLTVFLLLAFRQMLLVLLIVLAPVAILSWILPADTKLWSLWKGTFGKLLMLYPVVILLLVTGRVFAVIVNNSGRYSATGDGGLIGTILKLSAYILPYFFIPFVFKYAGGVFANIAGMVNDRERGIFDRSKKYRQATMSKNWSDYRAGNRYNERNRLASAINRSGRHVGAGLSNRFGFMARGKAVMEGQQTLNSAEFEKTNQLFAAYKDDDKVMSMLALHKNKTEAARWIQRKDSSGQYVMSEEDRNNYSQALEAANAIGFSSTSRRAALMNGATIGYGLEEGEKGWSQATRAMKEISGLSGDVSDEEAAKHQPYRDMMNQFQYMAKGLGRADLSGNTDGGSYDGYRAWSSVSLYQHGNSKPADINGAGNYFKDLARRSSDPNGVLTEQEIKHFGDKYGAQKAVAIFARELNTLGSNATGAARDAALKQREELLRVAPGINPLLNDPDVVSTTRGYDPRDQDTLRQQVEGT